MVCNRCKVIDENVFVFSFKGEPPHRDFFDMFIDRNCKLCMSERIYSGYRGKLDRPTYYADDFVDMMMLKKMKIYLANPENREYCPPERCSVEVEAEERFENVPREDRYLVTVSEFFETYIVTDDDRLYQAVNEDDVLISGCKRSEEALEAIL